MALSLETRHLPGVSVVTCTGRIGEDGGCAALQRHLEDVLPREAYVILNLEKVDSVDSSGLGLLVRWLSRTKTLGGTLKLCAVPANVREVLRVTRLGPLFDILDSETEALTAFQRPAAPMSSADIGTDVLCVETSSNVLAFLRESLQQAGYRVTATNNLADGLMMLQTTHPKVVIVGAALRARRDTRTAATFNDLLDARAFIELPATFSSDDPSSAGATVLDRVATLIANSPLSTA